MNRRSLLLAAAAAPFTPAVTAPSNVIREMQGYLDASTRQIAAAFAPPAVAIPRNFVTAMRAHLAESDRIWAEYGQEVWFINATVGADRGEPWR
jgi:hypothetical protein